MIPECTICSGDAGDELQCSVCTHHIHYQCALGFLPPDEFKNGAGKTNYICPPCVVGTSYELLHMAINAHKNAALNQLQPQNDRDKRAHRRTSVRDKVEEEEVISVEVTKPGDSESSESPEHHEFAELQSGDKTRAGKFKGALTSLKTLTANKTTVLLGDSNTHHITDSDVDPVKRSVAVRSVGGACIPAAATAFQQHDHTYPKIKRVVLSLGTNDELHKGDHCADDWPRYVELLGTECARVFPSATITFILPFQGISGVSDDFRKHLEHTLKSLCPSIKCCFPPSMRKKMSAGGVHINEEGRSAYVRFLQKRFTRYKAPLKQESQIGPHNQVKYPAAAQENPASNVGVGRNVSYRVGQQFPPLQFSAPPPTQMMYNHSQQFPPAQQGPMSQQFPPAQQGPMLREISDAITHMIMLHRGGPQQPYSGMNFIPR